MGITNGMTNLYIPFTPLVKGIKMFMNQFREWVKKLISQIKLYMRMIFIPFTTGVKGIYKFVIPFVISTIFVGEQKSLYFRNPCKKR